MVPYNEVKLIMSFLVDDIPLKILPNADAIFGFGHVDPRLAHHMVRLWRAGKADKIIISGASRESNPVPRGFKSEAEFYASAVQAEGVPARVFILEEKASNTLENVLLGMEAAHKKQFRPNSLIVVSLPPLLRRSRATFRQQFPGITTYGSSFPLFDEEWQGDTKYIRRILGEIDRLREYSAKGDIAPVLVPHNVAMAYNIISAWLSRSG